MTLSELKSERGGTWMSLQLLQSAEGISKSVKQGAIFFLLAVLYELAMVRASVWNMTCENFKQSSYHAESGCQQRN